MRMQRTSSRTRIRDYEVDEIGKFRDWARHSTPQVLAKNLSRATSPPTNHHGGIWAALIRRRLSQVQLELAVQRFQDQPQQEEGLWQLAWFILRLWGAGATAAWWGIEKAICLHWLQSYEKCIMDNMYSTTQERSWWHNWYCGVCVDQQVGTHQCILKFKNEEICGRYFKSEKAFNKHMMESLQHEQRPMPSGCAFVCSNQCSWCLRILKDKHAVEAHVTRAFKNGRCQKAQLEDKRLNMIGQRINCNDICVV